jgi:hypothetical protein
MQQIPSISSYNIHGSPCINAPHLGKAGSPILNRDFLPLYHKSEQAQRIELHSILQCAPSMLISFSDSSSSFQQYAKSI